MFFYFIYALIWPIFHLLFPYKVIGKENLKGHTGGYVICANHISFLDPVYIAFAMTCKIKARYMAKEELFKNKLLAFLLTHVGAFPIHRGIGASAGMKTAEEALQKGQPLVIFPEGTRSKDGKLGKAKAGAAMLVNTFHTFVVPISLVCKNQKMRPFRKMTLIVGEPVHMPALAEGESKRAHLRVCTAAIMKPIEEGLNRYADCQ